ncbi:MAG: biotin/lipoyl-containing protein, partial [Nesterenkonia sp.]
ALNRLLFPGPTRDYQAAHEAYGDLQVLHTRDFLYGMTTNHEHVISLGKGVRLLVTLQTVSAPDEKGMRMVMCTLNGQLRQVMVRDQAVEVTAVSAERADADDPNHVAAPFAGAVSLTVAEGDTVEAGQSVATIEAMKMEAGITTAVAGTVDRALLTDVQQVQGGDLLLVISPT